MTRSAALTLTLLIAGPVVLAMSAEPPSTTSVPIRLHGLAAPTVGVIVQGKTLTLQIDMGDDSGLVLHPDVLATLQSEPTGRTSKFFSMDGAFETPIVRLESVTIGSLTLRNVDARKDMHDESFHKSQRKFAGAVGFIGTGPFRSGQVKLDYPKRRVSFAVPKEMGTVTNICDGAALPFVTNQYGWTTPITTDFGVVQFGWDTGSPAILMSTMAAEKARMDTNAKKVKSKKFLLGGRDYGPQNIEIWSNIPLPPEIPGLIGFPFFKRHVVCYDYANSLLHIR
jgi:hypothetical protein